MARLVECVPNFSEGRRPEVVRAIVDAIAGSGPVKVLDCSSDQDHNRSVVTFVGDPAAVARAALAGTARAADLIDMEKHRGDHPRLGAMDVIPFIPISEVTMADCVALAHQVGQAIANDLGIPVYLYEHAAVRPERRNLADIRRGQYEALKTEIARPERHPDYGLPRLHPTAGATVVGAREPLIAFNVNLGTADLEIARRIARAVRGSSGGLVNVKAIGVMLAEKGLAQVSMNLTNYRVTPIHRALEMIRTEAARYGVDMVASEIVGLVPMEALVDAASFYLRLDGFSSRQVLENRLME